MLFIRSLLLFIALLSPAFGQDGSQIAPNTKDAAQALKLYLDEISKSGGRPDYTKPPASDLIHRVFDLEQLIALPPSKPSDLPWLLEWLNAANQTIKRMMYFSAKPGPDLDQAAVLRNLTEYQDQYASAMNFLIRIMAREGSALFQFMDQLTPEERTPIREAGVQKARGGGAELIASSIGFAADEIMSGANARLMTAAMRDTQDFWATFILPNDRTAIISLLARATNMVKDDGARNNLITFAATLTAAK